MDVDHDNPPYRATRLWNEVILAFRTGMPLKRHRHRIRHYSDCFTASDCISWLNCYLKNNLNFGPEVTRQQTMQLLQKFVKCHVIESAISKVVKTDFRDNSHLYKFVEYSPPKVEKRSPLQSLLRTPLSSRNANVPQYIKLKKDVSHLPPRYNSCIIPKVKSYKDVILKTRSKSLKHILQNSIPECHIIERRLAVTEIENIWRTVTINKFEKLLSPVKIEEVIDIAKICGNVIRHNSNKISKSGVVLLIDKTDGIPHWVISAMKCLANWPEASGSGSCLPNYPGFEKDVFKVVKDYFLNSQVTLIPPFIQTLIEAAISRMKIDIVSPNISTGLSVHQCSPSAKIKNSNNQKTSTPLDSNKVVGIVDSCGSDSKTNIQSLEGQLILNDADAIWENPLNTFYETEFYSVSPVTRVVNSESKESLLSLISSSSLSYHSLDTMSTLSACSRMTRFSKCTKIGSRRQLDHSDDEIDDVDKTLLDDSFEQDLNIIVDNNDITKSSTTSVRSCTKEKFLDHEFGENQITRVYSKTSSQSKIKSSHLAKDSLSLCSRMSLKPSLCERNADSSSCRTPSLCNIFEPHQMTMGSKNTIQKQTCRNTLLQIFFNHCSPGSEEYQVRLCEFKETLQYILLLLPVSNRRQLHLLLRMINKILKNNKLILDAKMATKDYLLETFLPAVMKFDDNLQINMNCAYEVLSFMVRECESLLKPSESMKEEVQLRVAALQRQRIKYSDDDTFSLTYCELISKQQYEEQKLYGSKQALFDLLEAIIQNKRISDKEKKQKLKQFQISHPDIFQERFSSPVEVDMLFVKSRKPLFNKFLRM